MAVIKSEKYLIVLQVDHLHNHITSLRIVESLVRAGHEVLGIFFLFDAAYVALAGIDLATDEYNASNAWKEFGSVYDIDLIVCAASAARRGIVADNLARGYKLGSIGNLVELADLAHKVIQL